MIQHVRTAFPRENFVGNHFPGRKMKTFVAEGSVLYTLILAVNYNGFAMKNPIPRNNLSYGAIYYNMLSDTSEASQFQFEIAAGNNTISFLKILQGVDSKEERTL